MWNLEFQNGDDPMQMAEKLELAGYTKEEWGGEEVFIKQVGGLLLRWQLEETIIIEVLRIGGALIGNQQVCIVHFDSSFYTDPVSKFEDAILDMYKTLEGLL
jgi:hypothetical protein